MTDAEASEIRHDAPGGGKRKLSIELQPICRARNDGLPH
jgi:hypothetical protein